MPSALRSTTCGNAEVREPAKNPCGSCPYRIDVPSGLWDASEYERLGRFDGPTHTQPVTLFLCHQQTGRVCAGWVACHDMDESLGLRIASIEGLPEPVVDAIRTYRTDVPVFASGAEAAAHGHREIARPGTRAAREIERLKRKQAKRDLREQQAG